MVTRSTDTDIFPGVETVPDLVSARANMAPGNIGLYEQLRPHDWQGITWGDFSRLIETAARQLQIHGCQSGDAIAIVAASSLLWDIAQYAIMKNGGIVVGIDAHDSKNNIQNFMESADIKGFITDNQATLEKVHPSCRQKLLFALEIHSTADLSGVQFVAIDGRPVTRKTSDSRKWPAIDGGDTATIIFTSGTTGRPKGIPYSHKQILVACQALTRTYGDVTEKSKLVCWLPLANLFQRMMNYCAVAVGASTHYVPNPQEVLSFLPEINPTVFIAVPRFYEKLYEGIQKKLKQAQRPVRLTFSMLHKMNCRFAGKSKNNPLAVIIDKATGALIFNKLREQLFGKDLKYVISGSAPMPVWLLEWYAAAGVLILEAYGISENIVPIACNTPQNYKLGTVGRPLQPNRVRLSKTNEVEVAGPGVFTGYFTDTCEQANMTEDGYLKTGDAGMIDADGYITLNGRKSDFFKTSTGRRIAPLMTEKALSMCHALGHVMIIGEGRKVPIACATVNPAGHNSSDAVFFAALRNELKELVSKEVPDHQKPAAALLLLTAFTVNGGEITANLKLRKKFIMEKYREEIDRSYQILAKAHGEVFQHQVGDKGVLIIL